MLETFRSGIAVSLPSLEVVWCQIKYCGRIAVNLMLDILVTLHLSHVSYNAEERVDLWEVAGTALSLRKHTLFFLKRKGPWPKSSI